MSDPRNGPENWLQPALLYIYRFTVILFFTRLTKGEEAYEASQMDHTCCGADPGSCPGGLCSGDTNPGTRSDAYPGTSGDTHPASCAYTGSRLRL
jgi:hypothetical protein